MKGICFIPPLYDATVKEMKDQTRRIMIIADCSESHKNYEGAEWKDEPMSITFNGVGAYCGLCGNGVSPKNGYNGIKPKYKVGDILYLKEPYKITHSHNIWYVNYKFDEQAIELPFSWGHKGLEKLCIQQEKSKSGWLNKLFMPAWCARKFIKITNVRAERLQDITEEDCFREGVLSCGTHILPDPVGAVNIYDINKEKAYTKKECFTPRDTYADLIDSINGEGTWDSNPYMWVYDYKLTDKPETL